MSTSDLFDRILNWLWLYHRYSDSPDEVNSNIRINISVKLIWKIEMFVEIASWSIPEELMNSSVYQNLLTAIEYAKAEDKTKVKEIHDLLVTVQSYLAHNYFHNNPTNLIHSN